MIIALLAVASIAVQADLAVVQDRETTLADAINAGDGTGIGALFALDATLTPARSGAITGRGAIEGYWQRTAGDVTGVELRAISTRRLSPDAIEEVGTYATRSKADGSVAQGRYRAMWRHTAKGWLIAADRWS